VAVDLTNTLYCQGANNIGVVGQSQLHESEKVQGFQAGQEMFKTTYNLQKNTPQYLAQFIVILQ
jgi:hypothetical protein